jgi:3-hydroxybutyryl-CoA dehydrogenase
MAAIPRGKSTVAVVGTGLLGQGIASVIARAGFGVVLNDVSASALAAAKDAVASAAPGATVRAEVKLEDAVSDVDIVIEAVLENLTLKQQIFERLGQADHSALLMSNSSVLPISQIAARTANPWRAVGTHWWNPPGLVPVVEVIRGQATSEEVMERTAAFLVALGKSPVRVERDVPGFVGNRLQHALWREALALVSEGTYPADEVDAIVVSTLGNSLARCGPMAEMKELGVDQVSRLFEGVAAQVNSEPRPSALLRTMVARGELGAKSGRGFLSWPPGTREGAARRLREHIEWRLGQRHTAPEPHAKTALARTQRAGAERLRLALWREALSMVVDRVCDAATLDLVALNTIGLRLAVMGPIENADYIGLDLTLSIHEIVLPSLSAGTAMTPQMASVLTRDGSQESSS